MLLRKLLLIVFLSILLGVIIGAGLVWFVNYSLPPLDCGNELPNIL